MTVFHDQFYRILDGEIYEKSLYLEHEHAVADFFSSMLAMLGYTTTDLARRIWTRNNKTVVVCLSDDFNICSQNRFAHQSEWFDPDTVVITDNHVTIDTSYCVYQLPKSYFGVFSYTPELQNFNPQRDLNFSVNRISQERVLLLLEFLKQSNGNHYINFNAWDPYDPSDTAKDCSNNFLKYWNGLDNLSRPLRGLNSRHPQFNELAMTIVDQLPIRNHDISIEQVQLNSYVNMVIESYSGDTTITFSEKTFRALCTPAPWTLYSCKGTVDYLKQLGFDVLEDLFDHTYNRVPQSLPGDISLSDDIIKIQAFITASIAHVKKLKTINSSELQTRCIRAATHNQELLATMRLSWPTDFASWLPRVIADLASR